MPCASSLPLKAADEADLRLEARAAPLVGDPAEHLVVPVVDRRTGGQPDDAAFPSGRFILAAAIVSLSAGIARVIEQKNLHDGL